MFRAYLIPMGLFVFGCSSSTTNEAPYETGGEAGQAGAAGSNTGGQAGAAGSNTGGTINTGGGDSGAGGNSGGTAGVPSGGGTGGTCVPKTCLTYAVQNGVADACGTIQDGCGNYIDCNGCDTSKNPYSVCGGQPKPNIDGSANSGSPNLCDGGCSLVKPTNFLVSLCSQEPADHNNIWFCTTNLQIKPNQNAVDCTYKGEIGTSGRFAWCCTA